MDDYYEATYRKVIRPQRLKREMPDWCDRESPRWVRKPIVQLRRYLGIECQYGMGWDESDDGWKHVLVRTFTDTSPEGHCWLIGFASFEMTSTPFLSAAWLHPFYRQRGLLRAAWPEFVERFGKDFEVDWPNRNMRMFLSAINHGNQESTEAR